MPSLRHDNQSWFGSLPCGFGLDVGEDTEEIAAEEFFQLLGGVAAVDEGGGDFWKVGGAGDFCGQDGEAVEV